MRFPFYDHDHNPLVASSTELITKTCKEMKSMTILRHSNTRTNGWPTARSAGGDKAHTRRGDELRSNAMRCHGSASTEFRFETYQERPRCRPFEALATHRLPFHVGPTKAGCQSCFVDRRRVRKLVST